jgi:phage baseplate assembly protein W
MPAYRSGATNPPRKEVIYKDIPLNFIAHPVTKTLKPLTNEAAIKRAVRNLILTNTYEKPYTPLYGGNIRAQLFELFTKSLELELKDKIKNTIRIYEPRASIETIEVQANEDSNSLFIQIIFRPENQLTSVNLEFSVERIR